MPYIVAPSATARSTTARLARTRSRLAGDSWRRAPARLAATRVDNGRSGWPRRIVGTRRT